MQIFRTKAEIKILSENIRKEGKTLGFVPTMGALHEGHLSLLQAAKEENDYTIVSIFVNPTQFNNPEDLKHYPRTEDDDLALLRSAGCHFVFSPAVEEMYPEEPSAKNYNFGGLDTVMEGKFRPGHFAGVAEIVERLFAAILPTKAYFGKKDFQQLAIIKYLNEAYWQDLNINIRSCDIVREADGLAMSSRNRLLNEEQRQAASLISQTLFSTIKDPTIFSQKPKDIALKITEKINQNKHLRVEYINLVNNQTLQPAESIKADETTICAAVYAGNIRLIDNVSISRKNVKQNQ